MKDIEKQLNSFIEKSHKYLCQVDSMRSAFIAQKEFIESLKKKINEVSELNRTLYVENESLENKLRQLEEENGILRDEIAELKMRCDRFADNLLSDADYGLDSTQYADKEEQKGIIANLETDGQAVVQPDGMSSEVTELKQDSLTTAKSSTYRTFNFAKSKREKNVKRLISKEDSTFINDREFTCDCCRKPLNEEGYRLNRYRYMICRSCYEKYH